MQTSSLAKPITTLEGHTSTLFAVTFNPSGEQVASGSFDNEIRIWDLKSKQCIETFRGHGLKGSFNDKGVLSVTYSQSGTQLASGAFDNTVKIWSLDSALSSKIWKKVFGPCQVTLGKIDYEIYNYIKSVAYDPDGSTLAAHELSRISLYDAHTFKVRSTIYDADSIKGFGAIVYAPSGNQIASGGRKCIQIFDPRTRKLSATLSESNYVMGVSFLGTETSLASGSDDGNLAVWDLRTNGKTSQLTGHSKPITSISYSPHRGLFVSASKDQKIKLWDTCLKCQATIDAQFDMYSVAFSPSGDQVVSGGTDAKVKIWDVSKRACLTLHSLTTHAGSSTTSAAAAAAAVALPPVLTSSSAACTSAKSNVQESGVSDSEKSIFAIKTLYTQGNFREGFALCKQVAELGNVEAQFMVGVAYAEGVYGVEKNVEEAEQWFYKASLQSHPRADYERARLLIPQCLTGDKILNMDQYLRAMECLSRAAQVGSEDIRLEAAELQLKGINILARGVDWSLVKDKETMGELIERIGRL